MLCGGPLNNASASVIKAGSSIFRIQVLSLLSENILYSRSNFCKLTFSTKNNLMPFDDMLMTTFNHNPSPQNAPMGA